MNNPPPIFITSTMVFIAYSTIISMLRGLSRIGFRVLSDGFRSIRFSSIFSDTLRYIGWRGTSESGSNEKKRKKKGFRYIPYLDRQKEDIFPSLNFFQSFSVTIEERREGEKKRKIRERVWAEDESGPSSVRKAFRKLETRT